MYLCVRVTLPFLKYSLALQYQLIWPHPLRVSSPLIYDILFDNFDVDACLSCHLGVSTQALHFWGPVLRSNCILCQYIASDKAISDAVQSTEKHGPCKVYNYWAVQGFFIRINKASWSKSMYFFTFQSICFFKFFYNIKCR